MAEEKKSVRRRGSRQRSQERIQDIMQELTTTRKTPFDRWGMKAWPFGPLRWIELNSRLGETQPARGSSPDSMAQTDPLRKLAGIEFIPFDPSSHDNPLPPTRQITPEGWEGSARFGGAHHRLDEAPLQRSNVQLRHRMRPLGGWSHSKGVK